MFTEFWIQDSNDRGVMTKVRSIAGDFYSCGWGTQIYKLEDGSWSDMLQGSPDFGRVALLDINGSSSSDIYAIGMNGEVLHFNGKFWSRLNSPTNSNLYSLDVMSDGSIIICGADGILLRGDWRGLQIVSAGLEGNLWDVTVFNEKAYIVSPKSLTGLLEYKNECLPVDFELQSKITTHRLCKNSNVLWSIGEYDLLKYMCGRWERVGCPEIE